VFGWRLFEFSKNRQFQFFLIFNFKNQNQGYLNFQRPPIPIFLEFQKLESKNCRSSYFKNLKGSVVFMKEPVFFLKFLNGV